MSTASNIEPTTEPRLIPRRVLFGDPHRISPTLSPDGRLFAYAAPDEGVMNVWLRPVDGSAPARPVTHDRGRGITAFTLCEGNRLVYAQDTDGDESWRLYLLDLASGQTRLVTPERGVHAQVLAYDPACDPDWMLVLLNSDNPQLHDVYGLDLRTGEVTAIEANPGHQGQMPFVGWLIDTELNVRGGAVPTPDGGVVVRIRDGAEGPYRTLIEVGGEDLDPNTGIGFTPDGTRLIMATSLGAPANRLAELDITSGKLTTLAGDPSYDLAGIWFDERSREPVVAVYAPDRARYEVLDPGFAIDLEHLVKLDDGDVSLVGSAQEGRLLLAATTAPHAPVRYYLYDRQTKDARFLFAHRDDLDGYPLARMEPFSFTARDGLKLHGYLTLPVNAPDHPLPAVLVVHGGPWMRDGWGYHPEAQWLANRGYAVIQVNYRGSTGYGKAHLNAGNHEWGRAMHDDLVDAVHYLSNNKVIDPARIGIYGASYGGYAALCGAVFNPDTFRCAISICGATDLATYITNLPAYAQPMIAILHTRLGNPQIDADADRLHQVSPLAHAATIRIPLLIAQGANDPRVLRSHADELVAALKQHGVPHTYLVFDDEGHGLVLPQNRERFYREAEHFLAEYLGGLCEDTSDQTTAGLAQSCRSHRVRPCEPEQKFRAVEPPTVA